MLVVDLGGRAKKLMDQEKTFIHLLDLIIEHVKPEKLRHHKTFCDAIYTYYMQIVF